MNTKVQDGLYHESLDNIPWHLLDLLPTYALDFGPHARHAAINDRFATLQQAPIRRQFYTSEIFEVEVEQGQVVKLCVRLQDGFSCENRAGVDGAIDLILVMTPSLRSENTLFVKTLWFNQRGDKHVTLDTAKYIQP